MLIRNRWIYGAVSSTAVLLLILDSKTAFIGAKEGIILCVESLIPSLFPLLVFTNIMNSVFIGTEIPFMRPLGQLLGIPQGGESLLILGMLGGYPVGAKAIYDTYESGQISANTAKRLLGFCNNAGPAFIFGIVGTMFKSSTIIWAVWGIHILSALLTGALLPGKTKEICCNKKKFNISFSQSLNKSIKTMASICGWVIIFRMIIHFLNRWILYVLPEYITGCIFGILELTNGCIALRDIPFDGLKLIICSGLLSFGGLCVYMQTGSVTKELGTGMYLTGKLIQTCISLILACIVVSNYWCILFSSILLIIGFVFLKRRKKIVVAL